MKFSTLDDATQLIEALPNNFTLIGDATNILFVNPEQSFIVQVALLGKKVIEATTSQIIVEAQGGEKWSDFVDWTLDQGFAGLENLALIPGTVGAAPVQNIGAYGVELSDSLVSLEALSLKTGEKKTFIKEECSFGYRNSIFKDTHHANYLITAIRLRLSSEEQATFSINYEGIRENLSSRTKKLRAKDIAQAVSKIRRSKLPDPRILGNSGSFFKNPIVPAEQAAELLSRYPSMPKYYFSQKNTPRVKLSAAWMIESLGWKGFRLGSAGVSESHALILVNHGAATGKMIWRLAQMIQNDVYENFGIFLEPEPKIVI